METFEKIANEDQALAELIVKEASEVVSTLSDDDILEEFLTDLENEGVDLDDEATIQELEALLTESPENVGEYVVEKAAELISEDITKFASGTTEGYETAAASKVVSNYFDQHGAANLGSAFGPSAVGVGSAIAPGADAGIVGGNGRLIGGGNLFPKNVNATSKISGILGKVYADNIRTASAADEDEVLDEMLSQIEAAAASEGQTVDDFVKDLGWEALEAAALNDIN